MKDSRGLAGIDGSEAGRSLACVHFSVDVQLIRQRACGPCARFLLRKRLIGGRRGNVVRMALRRPAAVGNGARQRNRSRLFGIEDEVESRRKIARHRAPPRRNVRLVARRSGARQTGSVTCDRKPLSSPIRPCSTARSRSSAPARPVHTVPLGYVDCYFRGRSHSSCHRRDPFAPATAVAWAAPCGRRSHRSRRTSGRTPSCSRPRDCRSAHRAPATHTKRRSSQASSDAPCTPPAQPPTTPAAACPSLYPPEDVEERSALRDVGSRASPSAPAGCVRRILILVEVEQRVVAVVADVGVFAPQPQKSAASSPSPWS